jgi:hypothetical protein
MLHTHKQTQTTYETTDLAPTCQAPSPATIRCAICGNSCADLIEYAISLDMPGDGLLCCDGTEAYYEEGVN